LSYIGAAQKDMPTPLNFN